LHKKGLLRLCFTQNIDGLEERAHLPADALVQAHGSIASQHCVECKAAADGDNMWKSIREGEVYYCTKCGGAVKPDIVFFGESVCLRAAVMSASLTVHFGQKLPARFLDKMPELQQADILLIFGTSLKVHPFADLTWCVTEECPRVLFNLEEAGDIGERGDDVLVLDQCDSGVRDLARMLGWEEELEAEWATTALPAMSAKSDKAPETSTTEAGQVRAQDDVEELAADIARTLKVEDVVPTSKIEVGGLKDEGLALVKEEKSEQVRPDTVETKVDAEAETRPESKVVDVDDHIASK
jgi:NAD-dependent histone deacetylase SIR2